MGFIWNVRVGCANVRFCKVRDLFGDLSVAPTFKGHVHLPCQLEYTCGALMFPFPQPLNTCLSYAARVYVH